MPEKQAIATYVSPRHPSLTFHVGDKTYKLKHGSLDIFDAREERRIDKTLAAAPRIRQVLKKVSRDVGVKMVQAHMAETKKQAVSGPMGTGHIQKAASEVLQHQLDTDMAQRNIEITPEAQDAAHAELGGMLVTTAVDEPPIPPKPSPEPPALSEEETKPKQGFVIGKKTGD